MKIVLGVIRIAPHNALLSGVLPLLIKPLLYKYNRFDDIFGKALECIFELIETESGRDVENRDVEFEDFLSLFRRNSHAEACTQALIDTGIYALVMAIATDF